MCDYSLHNVKSRPAKVGDKLTTHHFNTGTRGFAAPEDANTAVCVLPGTELAFAREVSCGPRSVLGWKASTVHHTTAIFRQINKDDPRTHHDALEFPDGQIVLLTDLLERSGSNSAPASGTTCYRSRSGSPGTGRAGRLICKLQQCSGRPRLGGLFCAPRNAQPVVLSEKCEACGAQTLLFSLVMGQDFPPSITAPRPVDTERDPPA
jgi:hypothetical protein